MEGFEELAVGGDEGGEVAIMIMEGGVGYVV